MSTSAIKQLPKRKRNKLNNALALPKKGDEVIIYGLWMDSCDSNKVIGKRYTLRLNASKDKDCAFFYLLGATPSLALVTDWKRVPKYAKRLSQ